MLFINLKDIYLKKAQHFLLTGWMVITVAIAATGQQVKVTGKVNKNTIKLAEPLELSVTVKQPRIGHINWPDISRSIAPFEFLKAMKRDTVSSRNFIEISQTFIILSTDTGGIFLPPLNFNYILKNDTLLISTDSIFISVLNKKVKSSSDIKDIQPPINIPLTFKEILPYLAGGLLILVVMVLSFYFGNRKRKKTYSKKTIFSLKKSPEEIALDALNHLEKKQLWKTGQIKEHYTKLSDLLRLFLEQKFQIKATGLGTDEIMMTVRPEISENNFFVLSEVLNLSDQVKFAKAFYDDNTNEQSLQKSYLFVRSFSQKKEDNL